MPKPFFKERPSDETGEINQKASDLNAKLLEICNTELEK